MKKELEKICKERIQKEWKNLKKSRGKREK